MKRFPHYPPLEPILLAGALLFAGAALRGAAPGIPEPDFFIYGAIRNKSDGDTRLIAGTLTWEFRSTTGASVVRVAAALTNINDQFSYVLRVPAQTDIGAGVSANTLRLIPTLTSYDRSVVTLGTNPVAFLQPAQATFTVSSLDRGRTERIDLEVSIDCLDSDGNGLCDGWELDFFGHVGVDPNGDPDGDGLSNLEEQGAGTDPNDPNSVFKFINVSSDSGNVRVEWSSVAGRNYTLERSGQLLSGFTNLLLNIPATAPRNVFLDTNAPVPGTYFYRVRVQP